MSKVYFTALNATELATIEEVWCELKTKVYQIYGFNIRGFGDADLSEYQGKISFGIITSAASDNMQLQVAFKSLTPVRIAEIIVLQIPDVSNQVFFTLFSNRLKSWLLDIFRGKLVVVTSNRSKMWEVVQVNSK